MRLLVTRVSTRPEAGQAVGPLGARDV
jgi:hypothetical protein